MKLIYTLLFFSNTLLLIVLANYLFKYMDKRIGGLPLALVVTGIGLNIFLLGYFLFRYLKLPSSERGGEI
jgi:hypothetical protein